jgi:hypothetical protein
MNGKSLNILFTLRWELQFHPKIFTICHPGGGRSWLPEHIVKLDDEEYEEKYTMNRPYKSSKEEKEVDTDDDRDRTLNDMLHEWCEDLRWKKLRESKQKELREKNERT